MLIKQSIIMKKPDLIINNLVVEAKPILANYDKNKIIIVKYTELSPLLRQCLSLSKDIRVMENVNRTDVKYLALYPEMILS